MVNKAYHKTTFKCICDFIKYKYSLGGLWIRRIL